MPIVSLSSDLKRKAWVREGLVQASSKSFWSPMTGTSKDAVVFQANNMNASDGNTVVFDYDGNLAGKSIKGKETAFGKGEQKRKFSNKINVERHRLVVDNGDKFDSKDVGDLSLAEHADSRAKLGDLFIRWKDQMIFDAGCGLLNSSGAAQTPTHIIDTGTTFDFNTLLDIERTLKSSVGFTTGGVRRPLDPYMLQDGRPVWLMVMDPQMSALLKKSSGYQSLVYNADVRGNENRAFKGVFGKIGSLILMETDNFFGATDSAAASFGIQDTSVEIAGLRQKDAAGLWTGQTGFSYAGDLISRSLILGAGAMQIAFGQMPDYKFQASSDFGITSESALEVWVNAQKTKLLAENDDYAAAKVAGTDWGVVAIDCKTRDV
jgi:Protein of unknown function (DUF4043)